MRGGTDFLIRECQRICFPTVPKGDFQSVCKVPLILSSNRQQAAALETHCEFIS